MTGQLRAPRVRRDGVSALTVYLLLLVGLPASMSVSALGDAGRPAQLFGLVLLGWWMIDFLIRPQPVPRARTAVRVAAIVFLLAMCAGYVAAVTRPISSIELSSADRGLLRVLSLLGVFLVAADGVSSRARFQTMLSRISWILGLFALLGLVQFLTGRVLIDVLRIPGLSDLGPGFGLAVRGGYSRPTSTATNPIEFGAVLGVGLALVLQQAMYGPWRSAWRWLPTVAVGMGMAASGSRSAFIAGGIVLIGLLPSWPKPVRHNAYFILAMSTALAVVLTPSFLRSIFELFAGSGTDDSVASRTASYDIAFHFISRYPVFGRGLGTLISDYRILDNQFLGTWIETGIVGLLSLILLVICGIATAESVRAHARDLAYSQLGRTLSAAIAAGGLSWLFYDGLSFPISSGFSFLILGLAAAARLIQTCEDTQDGLRAEPLAGSVA